jgi:hypothetical protein
MSANTIEGLLPYTQIEKGIYGNRYGEYRSRVPNYADFAVQVNEHTIFRSQFGALPNAVLASLAARGLGPGFEISRLEITNGQAGHEARASAGGS